MKRLGIIGGIGPESTVVYYRSILAAGRERFGGAPPPVLINSIDVQMVLRLAEEDPVPGLRDYLLSELGVLARGGASLALIAANTPHIVFDDVRQRSPIALVSIVEASGDDEGTPRCSGRPPRRHGTAADSHRSHGGGGPAIGHNDDSRERCRSAAVGARLTRQATR